jgi:hypothetical protein
MENALARACGIAVISYPHFNARANCSHGLNMELAMRRRRLFRYVFGFVFGASFNVCAETPPPATPFDAMTWKATLERKPSTTLRMGTLRVRLEQTTLDDVRRAASAGKVAHRGDAGDSIYWLCYTGATREPAERIWIVSHGEMGGSAHYVTDISAEAISNGHATADCPALPKRLGAVSLANHLWLGASERAATMRLGTPSYQNGAWRSYDFAGKVGGHCPGGDFDLSALVMLHVQNGRVNSLWVSQTTSCEWDDYGRVPADVK